MAKFLIFSSLLHRGKGFNPGSEKQHKLANNFSCQKMKACFKKCRTASVVNYRDKCKVFTFQHKIKPQKQTTNKATTTKHKNKRKNPPQKTQTNRREGREHIWSHKFQIKWVDLRISHQPGVQTIHLRVRSAWSIQEIFLCGKSKSWRLSYSVNPYLSPNTKVTYQCQCFGLLFKLFFLYCFIGSYYVSLRSEFRVVMSITISA